MKILFVFSLCMASALAGVQPWSRDAEDNYLSLYRKYCSGSASAGNDGGLDWHCKSSNEPTTPIKKTHRHELRITPSNRQQLVFIETPAGEYQHEILVTGDIKANQDTKVVVVPSSDTHNYKVKDTVKVDTKSGKPSIFFLKTNPKNTQEPSNPLIGVRGGRVGGPSAPTFFSQFK